jgi:hypothetical protein
MDEFTAIGKIQILAKAVSYIAGYNLRLLPIIQSISQLEAAYGKEDARTFTVNHAMQVLYPPKDEKDAKEFSEMLGYYTYKSASHSRSKSILNPKESGENISDQRRALLLPQEIKELGQDKEIVTLENTKPILCEKIRYYKDPEFIPRLLPPPEVSPISLIERPKSQQRTRPFEADDLTPDGQIKDGVVTVAMQECGIGDDDFEAQEAAAANAAGEAATTNQTGRTFGFKFDGDPNDATAQVARMASNLPPASAQQPMLTKSLQDIRLTKEIDPATTPKVPLAEAMQLAGIAPTVKNGKAEMTQIMNIADEESESENASEPDFS